MIDQSQFTRRTVAFYTLGCKLNFSETSTIARHLQEEGFVRVDFNEGADIYVINTCSVTETAEKKCRYTINKALRINPKAFIVVTGCFAQLKPENIVNMKGVDLVLGSNEKLDMSFYHGSLEKLEKAEVHTGNIARDKRFMPSWSSGDRTRTFLKVQDGCDYFCTYCTIPLARGRSRNASIAETVQQAREAGNAGAREIILTGVNIGDFGQSTGESFYNLIKELEKVENVERFRISSIEPNLLTKEIIRFVSESEKFMPHFHIPLQSGSDDVLKLMKRRYDTALFRNRVENIRKLVPHAFIGVDVITGVRGETTEAFEETRTFLSSLDISQLHVFTYSERPNTQALKIEHSVPHEERKRRSALLHEISAHKTRKFYQQFEHTTAKVLFEEHSTDGVMHGFTENYLRVEHAFNENLANKIVDVGLKKVSTQTGNMTIEVPKNTSGRNGFRYSPENMQL
ncbi:threonylcarbamoyladenosine tRNA methylthiotransferase MtaB [Marinilabilia salmonicolor]|uniref:tRNA (N(6)-L-threonylcarbamoyladenosine(37)-C(2))- methylthiotransferase MtaB n=1 Tax=Marinilabilia salmonicolor TaxID=989 RepID=UPI000D0649DB|nr:tRNA (N(6)-L-threonylcarbamoyladenosine(37)-C(2))-methylthiotransferase MtaB [Marinilabilia salmonicolor]PRZ00546.1 threonylcarbamoyladenosine tRNA methylthiotransferase MtaB [Marinilabilia salmonicolor]